MANVVLVVIVAGCVVAIATKWRNRDPWEPAPDDPKPIVVRDSVSFGAIFVIVLKVIAATALAIALIAIGLLLIDQFVYSFTG